MTVDAALSQSSAGGTRSPAGVSVIRSSDGPSTLEADVDVLCLRVGEEFLRVLFPAKTAVLEAPEWGAEEVWATVVDPHVSGIDVAGEGVRELQVAGEHARRE